MQLEVKIHLSMETVWKKLALFAWRRWMKYIPAGKKPVGIPGNRDPKMPCPGYSPRTGSA